MRGNGRVAGPAGLFVAVLIALGGASCNSVTHGSLSKDPQIDQVRNFGVVKEGVLYRGANPDGLALNQLRTSQYKIKTIVNLNVVNDDLDAIRAQDLKYYHFPIAPIFWLRIGGDDKQIKRFLEVVRDPNNQPVFVHDTRGATRTGEAVGAYEILDEHKPIEEVERELYEHHYSPFFFPYIKSYLEGLARNANGGAGTTGGTAGELPPEPTTAPTGTPATEPATQPDLGPSTRPTTQSLPPPIP